MHVGIGESAHMMQAPVSPCVTDSPVAFGSKGHTIIQYSSLLDIEGGIGIGTGVDNGA